MATGISTTTDSLKACHCLPSDQNDKLIIKRSRKRWCWNAFCQKKLRTSLLMVLVLIKSLSIKVFATTVSSYGVNAKLYGQRNRLKPSGLAMTKSELIKLLTSQICRNYFQAMIFGLNKFTMTSRHWYRSFSSYICRIHVKMGLGTQPISGIDFITILIDYFDLLTAVMESSTAAVAGFLDLSGVMFTYFLWSNCWF